MRWAATLLLLSSLLPAPTAARESLAPTAGEGRAHLPPAQRRRRRPAIPEGRAIGELSKRRCEAILRSRRVRFTALAAEDAPGVEQPIRLEGPLAGVEVRHRSHGEGNRRRRRRIERLSILDCRLAVAVLAWAPTLRGAGVARLEHYSVYRPGARVGGSGRPSGHATGLAIDVGDLLLDDGRRVVVEDAWTDWRRGVNPCPSRDGDSDDLRLLRDLVCGAYERELFQVVLTPHHDEHHENHLHLELRPGVTWSLIE